MLYILCQRKSRLKTHSNFYGGFDMINELALFNNVLNSILDDETVSDCSCSTPDVDVKETTDRYTLEMDLPGRTEKDVAVEIDHDTLTISSIEKEKSGEEDRKHEADDEQNEKWLIRERSAGGFSRSFTLPDDVNPEQIAASFRDGVLAVTMPRTEAVRPKRIAIEAAA